MKRTTDNGTQGWLTLVRTRFLLLGVSVLVAIGVLWPPAAIHAQDAFPFPLTETFQGASAPNWVMGGKALLTSGNTDPAGSGWLRLTDNTTSQAGYAYYNRPIPTGRGLVITFDYAAWGGDGADGLAFFLFDGATPVFNVGASGGSLGYAQKSGVKGLSGGYLGLGLDEFGNYSNPNEGRSGGPGFRTQAVAIRGPGNLQTGYAYLAGTNTLVPTLPRLDCPANNGSCGSNGAPRPSSAVYYRQVRITVTPVGTAYQVAVAMKFSTGAAWTELFGPFTMPTSAPGTLKMGFAASTGGSTNYHEIRNLNVTPQVPDLTASKAVQNVTSGGGSVVPGDELLYTVVLNNHTNAAISGVRFTDAIPDNTTYVANSAAAPAGATLNGTSPISITNITVPANGMAMVTFKVRVTNPIPVGVTNVSNQGTYTYSAITALTDGDAQSDGSQPTVIGVTAGPNFDNATKTVTYTDLDSNGSVSPGDRLTYHVVLPNTGNQDSPTTVFTDVLPANTTYVAGSAVASRGTVTYNGTNKSLNWTAGIAAGSQATLDFAVTVNATVKIRDLISNQGSVTYATVTVLTDADLATPGKQPTQLLAGGGATLAATKSAEIVGGGALQPGGQVRYTIRLTNTGSYPIAGATFADTLPAHTTYVSATSDRGTAAYNAPALSVTGINLASGETATIQLTVQLDSPLAGVTQIANQGMASYDSNQSGINNTSLQTDGDLATAGQQSTYTEIPHADLAVTKTVNDNNPAESGTVVYVVRVTNLGQLTAPSVAVSDPLPSGLAFAAASAGAGAYTAPIWNVGPLAPGASATLTLTATVNLGQGGSTITNTGTLASAIYDENGTNNVAAAGLTVKTTTLSGSVADAVTGSALSGVLLTITDAQGHTCTATTGAGGIYTVTSGQSGCLLAPGAATVAATSGAPAGYLLRSASTTIVPGTANTGNLSLVLPSLGGIVTDHQSGVILIGAVVTLTQGTTTCTATSGADGYHFTAGTACPLTGGPATVTASLKGYQDTVAAPTILDNGPTVQDLALSTADLLIKKSDGKTSAQPGEVLNYVLSIENQGDIAATGVVITDTLGAYLTYIADNAGVTPAALGDGSYAWTLADLAPGATISFTLQAQVASSLPDGTTRLANYAKVSAATADRDRPNNEVSDIDSVAAHPDLMLTKGFNATLPAGTGSTVTYVLSGSNRGHATATNVTVVDTLDARATYVVGTATLTLNGGAPQPLAPSIDSNQLTFGGLPDIPPGSTYVLTYNVEIGAIGAATPLANSAVINEFETDANLLDNTASVYVATAQNVDVYIQKSALANQELVVPGTQIVYTLDYGNHGLDPALTVAIDDSVPPNTSLVAGSITGGGAFDAGTGTISWGPLSLASQATGTVSFTVVIAAPLPPGVTAIANTATITNGTDVADAAPANNTATTNTPVAAQPDLAVYKTDEGTQVLAGDLLTYTIAYSNTGSQVATGVKVTDTLLLGLDYLTATPPGAFDAAAGTVTWNIGTLPVGELHTLSVTATVKPGMAPDTIVANRVEIADDGANGGDGTLLDNSFTDSDLVIAPQIVLEKRIVLKEHAGGSLYVGAPVTYTIDVYNSRSAPAAGIVVTDTLPANTTLIMGSVTGGGTDQAGVVTWNIGNLEPGASTHLSFAVLPNTGAGGATQTVPTLSTEDISGTVTITSSATALTAGSRPSCEFDTCSAFKGIYQGEDGTPSAGWKDNPLLTSFDDSGWAQPQAASTLEYAMWANPADLAADWVAMHTISETVGNFTFFRQPFCLPLNARGLGANIQVAGDDVSDIYLNGSYLGEEVGAGAAETFAANAGLQPGINLLAVQLLNNRHGGHDVFGGRDHSGLLFSLDAAYATLRPFAMAPSTVKLGQNVAFTIDSRALGDRAPYSYTVDYGDGSPVAPYQADPNFAHLYGTAGIYTATVTARAGYGCTGSDQVVVTVLPADANLLANPVLSTYRDANDHLFSVAGGVGVALRPAADLSIEKSVPTGLRIPGQTVAYQVVVANHGPSDVTGATVTDVVPESLAGVTWTCSASDSAACTAVGSGAITDSVTIQAGSAITYVVSGAILANATGVLANKAAVVPPLTVTDLVTGNNESTDEGPLTPQVHLSVSKYSSPQPGLAPGQEIHYVVGVSNSGPSDATEVDLVDLLPTGVTRLTWACSAGSGSACSANGSGDLLDRATVAAGSAVTYTAAGFVSAEAVPGTPIVNSVTVTYASSSERVTDTNTLAPLTSLYASKDAWNIANTSSRTAPFIDADGSGGISPGDTLKYRVLISSGANPAYQVTYDDILSTNSTLVAGSVTCSLPCTVVEGNTPGDTAVSVYLASIAGSGVVAIDYQATVNNSLPFQLASIANQGYVASDNAPSAATDDPATAEAGDATTVLLAMGSIRGVAWIDDGNGIRTDGEPSLAGVQVTLDYAVDNAILSTSKDTDATGAYTFTVLAPGEYRVGFQLREGFRYSAVWGADKDSKVDPSSGYAANFTLGVNEQRTNISSGQVSVLEYGYLPGSFANTVLADDGARHIVAGGGVGGLYLGAAITTSVDGLESATASGHGDGVVRPAGAVWAPGATGTLTVTASGAGRLWGWFDWNGDGEFGADEAVDLGSVITGTQQTTVPVAANYVATDLLFARIRLYPPDYALQYSDIGVVYDGEVEDYGWYPIRGTVFDDVDGDGVQDAGEAGQAGLTITIKGPGGVVLATVVTGPDGSYTAAGLTAGAYSVELTLPLAYTATTPLQVSAAVGGAPAWAYFGVHAPPPVYDLALTSDSPTCLQADSTAAYTATVFNQGTVASGAYAVTAAIPAGMSVIAASDGGAQNGGTLLWSVDAAHGLAPGASHAFTALLRADNVLAAPFVNNATIYADSGDDSDSTPAGESGITLGSAGDDDQAASTVHTCSMQIGKEASRASVALGDDITFTISLTNTGTLPLANIVVDDQMPAGMEVSPYDTNGWTPSGGSGVVQHTYAPVVQAGEVIHLTIIARVTGRLGFMTNTAVIESLQGEGNVYVPALPPGNGTSAADILVTAPTDTEPVDEPPVLLRRLYLPVVVR